METKRRPNSNPIQYRNTMYVDGSSARELAPTRKHAPLPEQKTRPREREQTMPPERQRKPQTRSATRMGIDFFSMTILMGAMALTVYMCISFLQVQANIIQMDKDILKFESELNGLIDANNAIDAELEQALDFDAIYQVAVAELGMVFPNNNDVITYKSVENDYLRQNGNIPEVKVSTLLDKIFP